MPCPSRSSTLSPKIQRYSMLPPRCTQPPCMNIDVKSVGKSAEGWLRNRLGTNAHCLTKGSPPPSSMKKNRTFRAISEYVTIGKIRSPLLSSPMGSIECSSPSVGKPDRWCRTLHVSFHPYPIECPPQSRPSLTTE